MLNSLSLVAIWDFSKGTRLSWLGIRLWGTKDASKGLSASGPKGLKPNYYLHLQHQAFLEYISVLPIQFLNHTLKLSTDWYVTGVLKTFIENKGGKVIFSYNFLLPQVSLCHTHHTLCKVTWLSY